MPDETTFTAKIMVKGRVTVPQNERTLMNLGVGDFVKVTIKKIAKDMPTTQRYNILNNTEFDNSQLKKEDSRAVNS